MARKTFSEKQALIELVKSERSRIRCGIVYKLKGEADELICEGVKRIAKCDQQIAEFANLSSELRLEVSAIHDANRKRLSDNKLSHFTVDACGVNLRDELLDFDAETTRLVREILEGE